MSSLSKSSLPRVAMALLCAGSSPMLSQPANCPTNAEPRHIFVTIGINDYQNGDSWKRLTTAVSDADSLEEVLERKFHYQSYESLANLTKSDRLRQNKATKKSIEALVEDNLPGLLCSNDDLIFFFSGHGFSREYETESIEGEVSKGENGYLVPFDGGKQGVSSLIDVKEFLEYIGQLRARHILVILDACYSGIAIHEALQGMKASGDFEKEIASRRSRKVITSAQANQTASDTGSVPGHSLFGGVLYQGLDQELAARGQGYIADSQLGEFLKTEVFEQNHNQLPDWVPFVGNLGGSLVLTIDQDLAGLYRSAMQSLVAGNFDMFRIDSNNASLRSPDDPKSLELQYRLALSQGKVGIAQNAIEKLRQYAAQTHGDSDLLALSRQDMVDIRHQLSFWENALSIPVSSAQRSVTIHAFTGESEMSLAQLSGSNEFEMKPEANLFFKLQAKDHPTFVYVFRIDKLGRIESITDFLRHLDNPVDSDSERLSVVQSGPESDDIQEWHFILTSKQIDAYESPPTEDDLKGAIHYVITIGPKQ